MLRCAVATLLIATLSHAPLPAAETLPRMGQLGAQVEATEGALRVVVVAPGSAAEAAGLAVGDELVALGDATGAALRPALDAALKKGASFTARVRRNGEESERTITPKPRPLEQHEGLRVEYGAVKGPHGIHRTILLLPEGEGPFPALYYLPGYPCQSVEYGNAPGHPIREFLAGVAREGFAVYRVEKSNLGDSVGEPCLDQDMEAEVEGFAAGLAALREHPAVDASRIHLFGHSMGGIQAGLVARETPVAGIIVYGSGALTWLEYWDANVRRQTAFHTDDPVAIDDTVRSAQLFNANVLVNRMPLQEFFRAHPEMEAARGSFGVTSDHHFMGRHEAFWQDVYHTRPLANIRDAGAPVLALWGEADFVAAREEHELLAATANHFRPGSGTFRVVPQSDHVFFRKASQEESMQTGYSGDFNPAVIGIVTEWMKAQAPRP